MPTRRGWGVLGAGLGCTAAYVGLGEAELLVVGIFLIAAFLLAWTAVRLGRSRLTLARRVLPGVVHKGQEAVVELSLTHDGSRPLLDLSLEDELEGLGIARFITARLRSGLPVTARYQVLCHRRGIYPVGPASVTVTDPLGLAQAGGEIGPVDRLAVYPAVEDLESLPIVRGRDPAHQALRPQFSHGGGEDFFTLRQYQVGDDLRRVHWRSSAKLDELMIRQLETPWQSRALVFLDVRDRSYPGPLAFEKAVEGAASVVRHLTRLGFSVDFWAGGQAATQAADGEGYRAAMEALAVVQPGPADLRPVAAALRRQSGGALVAITGRPDRDLAAFLQPGRDFDILLLLAVAERPFEFPGAVTVTVTPQGSWAAAWLRTVQLTWSTASAG